MGSEKAGAWMADFAAQIHENAAMLTDLDRQIGDADHGSNMDRGMKAVAALAAADFPDSGAFLKKAGMTLVSTVGGASGPLYGTFLMRVGGAWPAEDSAEGTRCRVAGRARGDHPARKGGGGRQDDGRCAHAGFGGVRRGDRGGHPSGARRGSQGLC